MRMIVSVLCLVFLLWAGIKPCAAQDSTLQKLYQVVPSRVSIDAETYAIFKKPKGGIVTGQYSRRGAGVVIDPHGIVVTNAHTVAKASKVAVMLIDGSRYPAVKLWVSPSQDLAFLGISVPHPLQAAWPADSEEVSLRDVVYTIGASEFRKGTLIEGTVTGIGRKPASQRKGPISVQLIQTSFNVYKGDSGTPVFDHEGRLLGIISAGRVHKKNVTFIVPSAVIKQQYETYLQSLSDK